jgi:hypothetical protein
MQGQRVPLMLERRPPVEIDEQHFAEWFDWGFGNLLKYLAKWAAFQDYLEANEL